jgi:hypothetical protein
VLPDGRVAYAIKNPRDKQTHRIMTPVQFLARLCALVPPPRHPLFRFSGVFAPHSSRRRSVVALRTREQSPPPDRAALQDAGAASPKAANTNSAPPAAHAVSALGLEGNEARSEPQPGWCNPASHIDWATLLKRIHDVDALACACGGRLRFIALIVDRTVAASILQSLDLPAPPPPIARARAPDLFDHPPYALHNAAG